MCISLSLSLSIYCKRCLQKLSYLFWGLPLKQSSIFPGKIFTMVNRALHVYVLYIYMYIYIYIYMYIYVYIHTYIRTYLNIYTYIYIYIYIYVHIYVDVYVYCIYTQICVCVYICVCVLYVYIYVSLSLALYTCTHILQKRLDTENIRFWSLSLKKSPTLSGRTPSTWSNVGF